MNSARKPASLGPGPSQRRRPACVPCVALSHSSPRHSTISCSHSPPCSRDNSTVELGALTSDFRHLCRISPHGCTEEVAHMFRHTCTAGADSYGFRRASSAHHSCPAGLSMPCLDVMHHAGCGPQRVRTVLAFSHRGACSRRTSVSGGFAVLHPPCLTVSRREGVSGRPARVCRNRWDAATDSWRHGAHHPLLNPHASDRSGCVKGKGPTHTHAPPHKELIACPPEEAATHT